MLNRRRERERGLVEKAEADGSVQNLLDTKHPNATTLKYLKRINTKEHPYNERHGEQRAAGRAVALRHVHSRDEPWKTLWGKCRPYDFNIDSVFIHLDQKLILGHI